MAKADTQEMFRQLADEILGCPIAAFKHMGASSTSEIADLGCLLWGPRLASWDEEVADWYTQLVRGEALRPEGV